MNPSKETQPISDDEIRFQRVATAKAVFASIRSLMALGESAERAVERAEQTFGVEKRQPTLDELLTDLQIISAELPMTMRNQSRHPSRDALDRVRAYVRSTFTKPKLKAFCVSGKEIGSGGCCGRCEDPEEKR